MALKNIVFFLLVLYFGPHGAYSKDCAPEPAQSIRLYANATLVWLIYQGEHCNITQYDIYVGKNETITYSYEVTDTFLDLSFLAVCELWDFTVIPMSNGIVGFGGTLTSYVPTPPRADLSLSHFHVSYLGGRDVLFDYALADVTYGNCTISYRLTALDKELGTSEDTYTSEYPLAINFLSPCVHYQFSLTAYNSVEDVLEGPPLEISEFFIDPLPQKAPIVYSVESGTTSFSVTFLLESNSNRCDVKTLYLDGGQYFNISKPLQNSLDWNYLVEVEVPSLSPGSMYSFRVYVENSAGFSPSIVLSVQTLDSNSG